MIDLESLAKPKGTTFKSREDELDSAFEEAAWWIGVVMLIKDFWKFSGLEKGRRSLKSL